MADIRMRRLASGSHAGYLRVEVAVTLSPHDEVCVAYALGEDEARLTREVLERPPRRRGLGRTAEAAVDAMLGGLAEMIERGRLKAVAEKAKPEREGVRHAR